MTILGLILVFRHTDNKAVERIRDPDLAGQARTRLKLRGEIEHQFLHGGGAAGLVGPGVVDPDMASGAGAGPAAIRIDAGELFFTAPSMTLSPGLTSIVCSSR